MVEFELRLEIRLAALVNLVTFDSAAKTCIPIV